MYETTPQSKMGALDAIERDLIKHDVLTPEQRDKMLMMIARNSCLILDELQKKGVLRQILYKLLERFGIETLRP